MGEHMKCQDPKERITNFKEVELGFDEEQAARESKRCLKCKVARCVDGCPVNVDIPYFIKQIEANNLDGAKKTLLKYNNLPSICGRVCPQENQCQMMCVLNAKKDPIMIGKLERYASDYGKVKTENVELDMGKKVAIVGSGPAGLTCAADLAKRGFDVTIFEALHKPGGVLTYGIPAFRLPKEIIEKEVNVIKKLGVKIRYNAVIGNTIPVDKIKKEFDAIFVGVGAGLPKFLGIPGENLNGVVSSNEFLTRVNLMKAYKYPEYETPISKSEMTVVIGGGNVAMDGARCAKRTGSDVAIIYRRTEKEMPARNEEIEHAKEEGIKFELLTNPIEIIGETKVEGIRCLKMELGEPDGSGRRRPVPIKDSEFVIPCDQVIIAIGRTPNPLLSRTTDIEHSDRGLIVVDEDRQTSDPQIFAGGDIARGETTVIEAMGDGKKAAKKIAEMLLQS